MGLKLEYPWKKVGEDAYVLSDESALDMLFIEIEKHGVMRGHATLIANARKELQAYRRLVKGFMSDTAELMETVRSLDETVARLEQQ